MPRSKDTKAHEEGELEKVYKERSEKKNKALFKVHTALTNECREVIKNHKDDITQDDIEGFDQIRFQKLAVVSLTQLAAVLSVDAGHDVDQFLKVCEANWREAHERAPKWG